MSEWRTKVFPVLNDGFVRVVDTMGGDDSVCDAARVTVQGAKQVHNNRGLLRYLMRHRHTSPFEFAEIVLHVRVPMDTWRQWIRHRTASVNEYSTRYREAIDSQYKAEDWRKQSTSNRQGSGGTIESLQTQADLSQSEHYFHEDARKEYQFKLAAGVARELARKDLPLSTYTEAYWKIDLHNLLHFLGLRMDQHAQWEIRQYATAIGEQIVAQWCPLTWEAFEDYRRYAMTFSRPELQVLRGLLKNALTDAMETPATLSKREKEEFFGKLERILSGVSD